MQTQCTYTAGKRSKAYKHVFDMLHTGRVLGFGYTHVKKIATTHLQILQHALPFAQVERVKSAFEKADKDSSLGGIASGALRTHVDQIRDEKV